MKQPADLWAEARQAAEAAAKAENERLPPEKARGFDCGFAWVVIQPARGKFVSWAKKAGIGSTRDYGGGGFHIWYSEFSPLPTQSISVHSAAARACVEVLKREGINAFAGSRLD